jgi:murein DD-endopeptidase MepM/ murein hydrolase activator NlpD
VTRGEVIAAVGNSGITTGPHLHYEIHVNGRVVDPLTYVLPGAIVD